ncbi:ribosomal protection-like ABC-F family protein [Edaphobacillus lindanitolerans]|uniref:Macrolide transport system ATP-binding/permease protein n=1 Tax=Edaphobacillus lindanitolerans TaxID=550447 RepID=A0A1U7PPE0_9BACI|nr:ABC-F family ATP-binding cassette domain-containing protein [Edaphobacillus lindanitolerans]SIT87399.1 macrolide transport system ATP-binding/permease protein [Edaphobacillus lindanitolerans]
MLLAELNNLKASYGETVIFDGVSADLPAGAVVALVGPNGAGKSTMMDMIAGVRAPDEGRVRWIGRRPPLTYFRQEQESGPATEEDDGQVLEELSRWGVQDGIAYNTASGGERMKLRLAAALAENSRLFLLDEPTNHLDRGSLARLVSRIRKSDATYLIVSHDRHFIDRVADRVWELDHGRLTVYEGNYTDYREKKEAARAARQKHWEQQQRKIAVVEEQIDQLSRWSDKAHRESTKKDGTKEYFRMKAKKKDIQIRSKRRRLEAELEKERIEKPEEERAVEFDMHGNRKKGRRVFELNDVSKSFNGRTLFDGVRFTVLAGERLGLVGPNGSGKSTLFRMLLGEDPHGGDIWRTKGMTVGWLSQSVLDLPLDHTMEEYFRKDTFSEQGKLRTDLANLGFTAEQWKLPLSSLSMGERLKVKLMRFIQDSTDVLLLDEPTNHLDLPSREELERTLESFPGTLLFASHDRYFMDRLADGLLVFEEEKVRKVPMGLEQWERRNEKKDGRASEKDRKLERLRLETEIQAVLGKLTMSQPGSRDYAELDRRFTELTAQLRKL